MMASQRQSSLSRKFSGKFTFRACELSTARLIQELRFLMIQVAKKVHRFLLAEDGPTAVEYAVMLALIIVVCLIAIGLLGQNAKTTFTNIANSIGS